MTHLRPVTQALLVGLVLGHLTIGAAAAAPGATTSGEPATVAGSPAATAPWDEPDPYAWRWDAPRYGWQETWEGTWYTSPRGTFLVENGYPDMDATHRRNGGGRGSLGYPTGWLREQAAGRYQMFERGVIYHSFRGGFALLSSSPITKAYHANGGGGGILGYPRGTEVREAPGWTYRRFENGTVYQSRFGTHPVIGDLDDEHISEGGGRILGYPTAPKRHDSVRWYYQTFERGIVYCMPFITSMDSCNTVKGGFVKAHAARGGGKGSLGYPVTNEYYSGAFGRWVQYFERGSIEITRSGSVTYVHG